MIEFLEVYDKFLVALAAVLISGALVVAVYLWMYPGGKYDTTPKRRLSVEEDPPH